MWSNPQETSNLLIFTEGILNGKLHFLVQCRAFALFSYVEEKNFDFYILQMVRKYFTLLEKIDEKCFISLQRKSDNTRKS